MKIILLFITSLFIILVENAAAQTPSLTYYAGSGSVDVSFSAITTNGINYFAIGNEGNKILIIELDGSGEVISNRTIKLIGETKTPVCRSASFDKYGNLDICGYRGLIGDQSTYEAFVLAYDYTNDTILWMHTIEATGSQGSAFNRIREVECPVLKEFVCGYTSEPGKNEEASWWGIDPLGGFLIQHDKLDNGPGRDEFTSFAQRNCNMQIVLGTFDYSETGDTIARPVACRYGPTRLWMQKGYLRETSSPSRIYANDITLSFFAPMFVVATGDGSGSEINKDLYYFKFNSGDGSLNLIRKIEFTNTDYDGKLQAVRQRELDDNNHQTIIYGNKNDPSSENQLGDAFLVSMYDHNQLSWAKSYPFTCHADGRGVDAMYMDDEKVMVVGRAFDDASGNWMGAILNVDVHTGSLPNCETDEQVELTQEPKIQLTLNADKVHRSDGIGSGKVTVEESEITSTEICSGFSERQQQTTKSVVSDDVNQLWIYPNPVITSTTISFTLRENSHITIEFFDLAGRKIKTLIDENLEAGNHNLQLNREQLDAGINFLKARMNGKTETIKVVIQ